MTNHPSKLIKLPTQKSVIPQMKGLISISHFIVIDSPGGFIFLCIQRKTNIQVILFCLAAVLIDKMVIIIKGKQIRSPTPATTCKS